MRIYKITNATNGKMYVGQTTTTLGKRFNSHVSEANRGTSTSALHNAIRKYGRDKFSFELLEECQSHDDLDSAERRWIKELNCIAPNGYNIEAGGSNVRGPLSEETKAKLREAGRDRKTKNPAWYEKICNAARNRSPEWRLRISKANTGKKANENQRRGLAHGWGRVPPPGEKAGENNGRAKLNREQVEEIRRLYATDEYSQAAIGEMFGVNQTAIGFIVRGVHWK
jgi:group I intron endonuclease